MVTIVIMLLKMILTIIKNLLNKKKGLMIMHDIKLEKSGSKKFWDEIKNNKKFFCKEIYCSKIFI